MKRCPHCEADNGEYASYCQICGQPLINERINDHPILNANGFNTAGTNAAEPLSANPATLWLILNIVAGIVFFCSCIGFLGGVFHIIGIIFASVASGNYDRKNFTACIQNTRVAKIFFIIGTAAGVLVSIAPFLFIVLAEIFSN